MRRSYSLRYDLVALFLLGASTAWSTAAAVTSPTDTLDALVTKLASSNSFRLAPKTIDSFVKGVCEAKRRKDDGRVTYRKYSCDRRSGIRLLEYDARKDHKTGPYLMYLNLEFANERYSDVKKIVVARMGKPQKHDRNHARWELGDDASLNRLGYPVIYISRDRRTGIGAFAVVLEQGESEE